MVQNGNRCVNGTGSDSDSLLRKERILDRCRIHAGDRIVGQVVFPDRLSRLQHAAPTDMQYGGNLVLAGPSLQRRQGDLLRLRYRHSFPPEAPRIGRLRRILWRY